jgi:hypothetical protein
MKNHNPGPHQHPALPHTLAFDRATYRHRDQDGRPYTFGTRFLAQFFPPFDADSVAAKVSARTGQPVPEILAAWKATGEYGDEVHAYAEARLLGLPPATDNRLATTSDLAVVDAAIEMLSPAYEWLGVEQIVFDPLYALAARVDVVARSRESGAIAILDWKTNKLDWNADGTPDDRAFGHALPPIEAWPDSKVARFALELSLSAFLMLDSGYFPPNTAVELACIHIPRGCSEPRWIPMEYAGDAIQALIDHSWGRRAGPTSGCGVVSGGVGDGDGGGEG